MDGTMNLEIKIYPLLKILKLVNNQYRIQNIWNLWMIMGMRNKNFGLKMDGNGFNLFKINNL